MLVSSCQLHVTTCYNFWLMQGKPQLRAHLWVSFIFFISSIFWASFSHSSHISDNSSPFIGTNFCEPRQLWLNFPISMQIMFLLFLPMMVLLIKGTTPTMYWNMPWRKRCHDCQVPYVGATIYSGIPYRTKFRRTKFSADKSFRRTKFSADKSFRRTKFSALNRNFGSFFRRKFFICFMF